jgi:calcineurin-like phosphoesterase family protein
MNLEDLKTGEIVRFHTPKYWDTVPEWKVLAISGENIELIEHPRRSDNHRRFATIGELEYAYTETEN